MDVLASRSFANGTVYALRTASGAVVETTDTFLPMYTSEALLRGTNQLESASYGDRSQRWMIGVSVLSGCPVMCRFCACNGLTRRRSWQKLSASEMIEQIAFVVNRNETIPANSRDFKVLFTRMGEPGFNSCHVIDALDWLHEHIPNATAAISTVAPANDGEFLEMLLYASYGWREDFIQLQVSLHSTDAAYRQWLIPCKLRSLDAIAEFGRRWKQNPRNTRKITLNFALTRSPLAPGDGPVLDVGVLARHFDPALYFIKLSPLNENLTSREYQVSGLVPQQDM